MFEGRLLPMFCRPQICLRLATLPLVTCQITAA